MPLNLDVLLATDPTAKKLLDIITENRSIRLHQLLLASETSPEQAMPALKKLADVNLIATSSVDVTKAVDFDSYYVTASGLEAQRRKTGFL